MDFIARARAIVSAPRRAWPQIAVEPDSGQRIFSGYVVPLAAIGPVCAFISSAAFSHRPVLGAVVAIASFVSSLVFVWVESLITAGLMPRFGGTTDRVQALKIVAYSSTPGWLAGILQLVPLVGVLALLARLYGLYLLRLGVTPVLGVREDRATDAFLVLLLTSVAVAIVLAIVEGGAAIPFALAGGFHGLATGR